METKQGRTKRDIMKPLAVAILCVMAFSATAAIVRAQQPPAGATDGFVPVENLGNQEKIPAAPLVMGAYAIAWIMVFGYLWSIWQRLNRVERELGEVSRRVPAGGARR
jgi:CcmD family protein